MDNFNGMNEGPMPLGSAIPMPPPVPQLPPQMFTTAAQLLDLTDSETHFFPRAERRISVWHKKQLRWNLQPNQNGPGNLVLQDTIERLFAKNLYADIPRGLFLIRGENVVLLGEIDLDKEEHIPEPYKVGPVEEVFELHKQEQALKKQQEKQKTKRLQGLGFLGDSLGDGGPAF
ncbi:hypothetical protein MBLNU457_4845t2 [Dothideomycetes sp. NU457]